MKEIGANPIDRLAAARLAGRCKATSKRSGFQCRAPAVKGWSVCRCHGARGGAPKGERNGAFRQGNFTGVSIAQRHAIRRLLADALAQLTLVKLAPSQPGTNRSSKEGIKSA